MFVYLFANNWMMLIHSSTSLIAIVIFRSSVYCVLVYLQVFISNCNNSHLHLQTPKMTGILAGLQTDLSLLRSQTRGALKHCAGHLRPGRRHLVAGEVMCLGQFFGGISGSKKIWSKKLPSWKQTSIMTTGIKHSIMFLALFSLPLKHWNQKLFSLWPSRLDLL